MSELATTLEQMQYDILQGDLSQNPYLQPHSIASRDKELKTNAKKIIPAINELLKRVDVCDTTMNGFTSEVDKTLVDFEKALKETLTQSFKVEMESRLKEIEQQQAQLITAAVQEAVDHMVADGTINGGGASSMKKVLVEKFTLAEGESKVISTITQENLFPENVIVYEGGTLLPKGIDQIRGSSSSLYDLELIPLKITAIVGGLQFKNTNASTSITVLVYQYE